MNFEILNYISRHWNGNFSLAHSFWVNLVLLFFTLNYLERFIFPPFIEGEKIVTVAVIIFFIIARLIVYPWQVVGVLKACDKSGGDVDRHWLIAAQGVVVLSLVGTLVSTFSSYQTLLGYKHSLLPVGTFEVTPKYTFDLVNRGNTVYLRGPFQLGITRRFAKYVDQNPGVTGVILDSDGGRISEGRGIARVIRENRLDTYSLDQCMSACTTAFAAGVTRAIGTNTKIGFHQYQAFTVYPRFDIDEEQAKDIALFKQQGISEEFLEKIFTQPPEEIWQPKHEELLNANFVHQIGFNLEVE